MRSAVLLLVVALPALAQDAPTPSPFERAKVRALLRDRLPCLGCHEYQGEGGRVAPSLTDVSRRRSAAYIRAIVATPARVVPHAAMPRTPTPAQMRELVVRVLVEGAVPGPVPAARPEVPQPAASAQLYGKWCSSCHGADGGGDGSNAPWMPVPPAVHASDAMAARSDDALYDMIAAGGAAMGRSPRMPAFGESLSDAQIRQLVAYIRTLCRCEGPAWSRQPGGGP